MKPVNHPIDQTDQGPVIAAASAQIVRALDDPALRPVVQAFFDEPTFTLSYVIHDPATLEAAVIDPVLDYHPDAGRTSHAFADRIVDYVKAQGLKV
ncbi:MAG TPA: MBL fold metallo-hydrolase, partial [Sphingomonadaceae bacterium]|nr:MBL fold metallo-hydrolase [Sphingomonadaceae bacterium]